jgi:ABC-type Na+ efflux pump permease subunit
MVTVIAIPFGSTPALPMSLIPFLSAFAAPIYYVTGDISIAILLLSWVIQIATIALVYKLSGKAYDSLIMYKGKRLKMTQIFRLALGKELKVKEEK